MFRLFHNFALLFKLIKKMEDQKLRELCVSYAMQLIQEQSKRDLAPSFTPIDLADRIYQYIKTGEKDERLVKS